MKDFIKKSKIMQLRIKGMTAAKARWWHDVIMHDSKNNFNYASSEKKYAYKHGFLPEILKRYNISEDNINSYISLYDYVLIYPVNDIFRKWLQDKVTTRKVLKPFKKHLPENYFHLYYRDEEPMIIALDDCPQQYSEDFEGVLKFIRDKKRVCFAKPTGYVHDIIVYRENNYYYNNEKYTEKNLIELIKNKIANEVRIVLEYVEGIEQTSSVLEGQHNTIRIIAYNKYGDNPRIGQAYLRINKDNETRHIERNSKDSSIHSIDGFSSTNFIEDQKVPVENDAESKIVRPLYVPIDTNNGTYNGGKLLNENNEIMEVDGKKNGFVLEGNVKIWNEIKETIYEIGMFIPQIELMGLDIVITADGFKIVDIYDEPYYPQAVGFNNEMTNYFKMKIQQTKEHNGNKRTEKKLLNKIIYNYSWKKITNLTASRGMRPLIYRWWFITIKEDFFSKNGISLKDKLWAYKHGFLSYRIHQYDINKNNYKNYISDYDYRYIRHINNKYRVWLEDKYTVKYICDRYQEFFPKYYYHFSVRNGEKRIIRLMDLPDYCDGTFESVFKLVRNVGALACKPQRGSQGQGFYKLSYQNGKYYLNHEEATEQQIIDILSDGESQYFVTEYIKQHERINKIYDGAVNTLRIITFMRDGKTTEIGNAYMRFGSQKTGAVDNMGAGGMFVQVDMDSGRFYNGKIITENSILPCAKHPDTGELMEGYIPNWSLIKNGIISLNKEMPQLEYLGFDVAITQDGMKLPEINRAPGYPKIECFNRKTIDYLLYKRKMKMKKYEIKSLKW